ncbi:MAG: hypothetical protein K6T67_14660, partial [Alicyclobacillus sp.]|nr:hypothetical protein [Alicyclobacillus sp.]
PAAWRGQVADVNRLLNADALAHLPPEVVQMMHAFLENGLHAVFTLVVAAAVVSLIATLLMPSHRAVMAQQKQVTEH